MTKFVEGTQVPSSLALEMVPYGNSTTLQLSFVSIRCDLAEKNMDIRICRLAIIQ